MQYFNPEHLMNHFKEFKKDPILITKKIWSLWGGES